MLFLKEVFPGHESPATEIGIMAYGLEISIATVHEYALGDGRIEPIITHTSIVF